MANLTSNNVTVLSIGGISLMGGAGQQATLSFSETLGEKRGIGQTQSDKCVLGVGGSLVLNTHMVGGGACPLAGLELTSLLLDGVDLRPYLTSGKLSVSNSLSTESRAVIDFWDDVTFDGQEISGELELNQKIGGFPLDLFDSGLSVTAADRAMVLEYIFNSITYSVPLTLLPVAPSDMGVGTLQKVTVRLASAGAMTQPADTATMFGKTINAPATPQAFLMRTADPDGSDWAGNFYVETMDMEFNSGEFVKLNCSYKSSGAVTHASVTP